MFPFETFLLCGISFLLGMIVSHRAHHKLLMSKIESFKDNFDGNNKN